MDTTATDCAHDDESEASAIPRPSAARAGRAEAMVAPLSQAPSSPVIPCPRSRSETALLWTFGILDVLTDMATEPVDLLRQRVRLLRHMCEQ
jgi:hypothetical protein